MDEVIPWRSAPPVAFVVRPKVCVCVLCVCNPKLQNSKTNNQGLCDNCDNAGKDGVHDPVLEATPDGCVGHGIVGDRHSSRGER